MKQIVIENLNQILDLLSKISVLDYNYRIKVLSQASIGQHIRHILEFYQLTIKGAKAGVICYDKRERNINLETKPDFAYDFVNNLINEVMGIQKDRDIYFKAEYDGTDNVHISVKSSLFRELAYCVEHSIHHQAIIKTGLHALEKSGLVNDFFGVAYSTIQYRNKLCAQ